MSDKDKKKGAAAERTGSVNPQDAVLTTWLHRLWARNEPPQRLEVWQMFGRNKSVRGEMIHHEDFKANDKLDVERANRLANEVIAAAQHDCDSTPGGRAMNYQIAIIDRDRKASPLIRRLGPLHPERQYLKKASGEELDEEDAEDDDRPLNAKSLMLGYIKEGFDQLRWDKNRYDRVMGDMLMLQGGIIVQQQGWIDKLFGQSMNYFAMVQAAEDRRLDRDQAREWGKLKVSLARDGLRTVRNLLPGLFAPGGSTVEGDGGGGGGGGGGGATNGASGGNGTVKDYGRSPERALVENFLSDCEESNLSVALFGDFEKEAGEGGKLKQVKPGIFTLKQYAVLVGVSEGRYPPAALDALMPKSGHADAITEEQIKQAGDAGVTEGIGLALLELVGLRKQAQAQAAQQAQQQAQQAAPAATAQPQPTAAPNADKK